MPDNASLARHPVLLGAMREAGQFIEAVKVSGIEERGKADDSPVTQADEGAEEILVRALQTIEPDAVIVGEEACAAGNMPDPCGRFWLIDPLDGTRDFIAGRDAYTVNLGLVIAGRPVLGFVLHPPTGRFWVGAEGAGAALLTADGETPLLPRAFASPPAFVASKNHLDPRTAAWIESVPGATCTNAGSSLKFCLLAGGSADAYPRYGPTMEWDTAAADAILRAAGGITLGPDGQPLTYGKPGYRNGSFLALAHPANAALLPAFVP